MRSCPSRRSATLASICAALLLALAGEARAEDRGAGPFSQGRVRISATIGSTGGFGADYIAIGVGGGYFVVDGLEAGLDAEVWVGDDPTVGRLGPQVRYVLHFVPVVKPYVGGFYKHWFVEDVPEVPGLGEDLDSLGVRGGFYYVLERVFVGGGVAYERFTDCPAFGDCSDIYPEFALSFTF
ncbi:MAG: hypothetical protein ACQEXJ_16755 [Myxococcota bacterium]